MGLLKVWLHYQTNNQESKIQFYDQAAIKLRKHTFKNVDASCTR